MSAPRATPFEIAVSQSRLDDLRRRLESIHWAPDMENDDWRYGTNGSYLRELVDHWLGRYDWRAQERAMNTYDHFRVPIEGIPIHFIHAKGKGPNPLPLILSHGWPWTFWDFEKVIGPLSDPASHGGDAADAFDVVLPSLPGFGFSTPLEQTGINWWRTADLWAVLMRDVLGYERFCAHGGDWGTLVTLQLGHRYAELVHGIHVTGVAPLDIYSGDRPWAIGGLAEAMSKGSDEYARVLAWEKRFASHVAVQSLDPQTLAFAMHDSPLGLCSWILERRRNWGDTGGDVETRFSKDDLVTTMMIYWLTDSFVTSVRYYREAWANPWKPDHDRMPVVEAPTGVSYFEPDKPPGEMEWTETYFNRKFYRLHPHGGHFAPAEEPEALVADIREMFRKMR
ncbi:MAG: epoxide hydrolase [Deltaproteobacteria bacterium]|jgi:pimeloyl-ACP methyl ester carboxylesterase|nr:epoxide hydrolase [Deltaproteobacteria bacterium]MBW2498126.1 epoxide hydrolase [Deltaproteobacteria bacterium]